MHLIIHDFNLKTLIDLNNQLINFKELRFLDLSSVQILLGKVQRNVTIEQLLKREIVVTLPPRNGIEIEVTNLIVSILEKLNQHMAYHK